MALDGSASARLVVVDDHRMFAESLLRLLADDPDFVPVGVAGTIAEAVALTAREQPDIVLLDFRLPDGDAPACIPLLRSVSPSIRVVVMTGLTDESTRAAAVAAGCAAVVTKDHAARDLLTALREAIPERARGARGWPAAPSRAVRSALSPRERDVLVQLAAGHSTTEIAKPCSSARSPCEITYSTSSRSLAHTHGSRR